MLALPLVTIGLAIIGAYAKPTVRATDSLEDSLSTPADNVLSVSDLRVIATVKNTGDKEDPFTGTEVPTRADHLSENDWVLTPAGSNVIAEHDANDPGTFTFDPVSEFQIIGPNDAIRVEVADFRSVFVPVPITDVSKRELKPEKGQVVKCADSENGWAIAWSVIGARFMANAAALYINKTGGDDELYSDYFGPDDSTRAAVIENFMKIANSNNDSMILSCPDSPNNCDLEKNSVYHENKDIFFCDSFYNELPFESLCTNDPAIPERGVRSVTTLFYLLKALIPGSYSRGGLCLGEPSEPISENIDNYICFVMDLMIKTKCQNE